MSKEEQKWAFRFMLMQAAFMIGGCAVSAFVLYNNFDKHLTKLDTDVSYVKDDISEIKMQIRQLVKTDDNSYFVSNVKR